MKNKTLSYANGTPIVRGERLKAKDSYLSSQSLYRFNYNDFNELMSASLDVCHKVLEEFDRDGYNFKVTFQNYMTLGNPSELGEIKVYYQPTK